VRVAFSYSLHGAISSSTSQGTLHIYEARHFPEPNKSSRHNPTLYAHLNTIVPITTTWSVLKLRMEEGLPDMTSRFEYIK
jgi:hypothetical protein